MKFQDAIKKSIKSFQEGNMPKNLMELSEGNLLYTPDYFDELEESLMEKANPSKKKKSKKEPVDDADI